MSASESLCCCEYDNKHGERSHLMACCCDCEAFDQIADRCCKCEAIPPSLIDSFLDTLADRCRLPGFTGGGAIKINLELAMPLIVIPASLLLASIGPIMTAIVLCLLPCFCIFFYTTWKRRTNKTRTKFFFIWGLTSLTFMYFLFEMIICANTHVDLLDNLIISVSVIVMCAALRLAKKDPGIIPKSKIDQYFYDSYAFFGLNSSDSVRQGLDEDLEDYEIVQMEDTDSSNGGNAAPTKKGDNWCVSCNIQKPSRSGHCRVCDVCVANRDHHCVWIDSCIGAENHRSFLVAMTMFVCTGYYGSYVTLTSICGFNDYATCYISAAYAEFRFGLCFASACYTILVATIMLVGLVHQFILISQNATSQEMHVASQQGDSWCSFYRMENPYNHGVVQNWTDFIQKRRIFGSYETV